MADTLGNKTVLYDVVLIRLLLILLLVIYHAFAPYCGAWAPFEGQVTIASYWWIGKLAYSSMLPTFFFISGFVFGNSIVKGKDINVKAIILKKLKRLICPLFVFGIVYVFLFYDINKPFYKTLYSIVSGAGHLWFLLVLFECFFVVAIHCKIVSRIKNLHILLLLQNSVLVIAILLSVFSSSFPFLPFRLNLLCYYYIFFFAGYYFKSQKWSNEEYRISSQRGLILNGLIFFTVFVIGMLLIRNQTVSTSWLVNLTTLIISSLGISFVFAITGTLLKSDCVYKFSTQKGFYQSRYCFGIYIFQEFILKALYASCFVELFSAQYQFLIPWIGIVITLLLSTILCKIFEYNRIGKYLLGL